MGIVNGFRDKSKQHSGVRLVYSEVTNLLLTLPPPPLVTGSRNQTALTKPSWPHFFFITPKFSVENPENGQTPKMCGLRNILSKRKALCSRRRKSEGNKGKHRKSKAP